MCEPKRALPPDASSSASQQSTQPDAASIEHAPLHGKDRIDQSASRAPTDRRLGREKRKRNEQNPSSPSRSRSVVLLDLPEVHRRELFSMGRLAALQQRRRRREGFVDHRQDVQ